MAGRAGGSGREPESAVPLSREQILQTALRYVDHNGLTALSMHKLGAELGVQAMSLYYYVENKDDVLDGLVDELWSEIDPRAIQDVDWRSASRLLAHALRDLVHRHPHAAPLLMSRRVATPSGLRVYAAYLTSLQRAGFERGRAREILRILVAYGFGYAQTELAAFAPPSSEQADQAKPQPRRRMGSTRPDLPDDLLDITRDVCSGVNTAAHFNLGLDLIMRGLETDGRYGS